MSITPHQQAPGTDPTPSTRQPLGDVILERPSGAFEEYHDCEPPRFTDAGVEIRNYSSDGLLQFVLVFARDYYKSVGWYR